MPSGSTTTAFPLGAYLGNPDNSSAINQATYQAEYDSFTKLMGAAPQFLTSFIDQRQAVNQWVSNSMWAASSAAAASVTRSMTPVIALPLSSNASGSASADSQFQAFASGAYDGVVQEIVKAWTDQGFKNLVFRPGWEMNLQGLTYAGDDAASQADWVKAFQHVYTVLHAAAAANGATMQVVWNPGVTNYSNALATTNLYPGDNYVDVIGADIYADLHPYSDGGSTPAYHDWNTGGTDATVAKFIADPVNRTHYWSYPAATKWSLDGSGGHSLSLTDLIGFAQAHGKPFAIPETGAGNSNAGTDVADDAAFPQWLAQQLAAAKAAGTTIAFVNLWDSNGGGNYEFSSAGSGKPAEAAAWAQYFGATAAANTGTTNTGTTNTGTTPASTTTTPATTGSGTLHLQVSEDAWNGDARFTVAVDGTTIGGVQTASASHAAGATQDIALSGTWGPGSHTVAISFINDAYGGTSATDRNLYVGGVSLDGRAASGTPAALMSNGTASFTVPGTATSTAASTALTLHLAEDAWNGDAQYAVSVDGATLVSAGTATAPNGSGSSQAVALQAMLTAGTHDLAVSFLNDAYGGTSSTDRNLYVKGVDVNGTAVPGASATLLSAGTAHFTITVPSS